MAFELDRTVDLGSPVGAVAPDALRSLALVLKGHTYREAATLQGLPPGTVARQLGDALRSLRDAVADGTSGR